MTMHVLDRPALSALRSRHSHHARQDGKAFRYDPEVAPFVVTEDDSEEAIAAAGRFVMPGTITIMLQKEKSPLPPGAVVELSGAGVQMLAGPLPATPDVPFLELGAADSPDMLDLATLTRPGPFFSRTHELGGYVGIRDKGRLVAMAGERFKVPGYTEVSAVCTHPDYRGRGYAAALTLAVANRIAARGETPFLHTFAGNTTAIRLYEKLGFTLRTPVHVTILRRA